MGPYGSHARTAIFRYVLGRFSRKKALSDDNLGFGKGEALPHPFGSGMVFPGMFRLAIEDRHVPVLADSLGSPLLSRRSVKPPFVYISAPWLLRAYRNGAFSLTAGRFPKWIGVRLLSHRYRLG